MNEIGSYSFEYSFNQAKEKTNHIDTANTSKIEEENFKNQKIHIASFIDKEEEEYKKEIENLKKKT